MIHHRVQCHTLVERIVARDPTLTEPELVHKINRICQVLHEELYEAW